MLLKILFLLQTFLVLTFCNEFANILHKSEEKILKGYLKNLSLSPLITSESLWLKTSTENEGNINPTLAKMLIFEDGCLDYVLHNNTLASYGTNIEVENKNFHLICVFSGNLRTHQNDILEPTDCIFGVGKPTVQAQDQVQVLVLSWDKSLDLAKCPKISKVKSLYEILTMTQTHFYHFAYAGDKYLLSKSHSFQEFVKELKKDKILVNPTLPDWDSECQEMAEEFFEVLDNNNDKVLDRKDIEKYLKNKSEMNDFVAGKVKDFAEIEFDMKIVKAGGPMDFTLPQEEVEAMIIALSKKDLQIWQDNLPNNKVKDEL